MKIIGTNIRMIRGDTEAIRVIIEDANGKVAFADGDMVYLTVKENANTERVEFQKVVTEFTNGEALIKIEPTDTKGLYFKDYVYDIQLNRSNGDVKTIVPHSNFTIEKEVTHE